MRRFSAVAVLCAVALASLPRATAACGPEHLGCRGDVLIEITTALERRAADDMPWVAAALAEAHRLVPADVDIALALARTQAALRRYGAAARSYARAVSADPGRLDALLEQARFHLTGGFRLTVAREALQRARALTADDPAIRGLLDEIEARLAIDR